MKKFSQKTKRKLDNIPVRDPIAILIARLIDPTDPIYDEDFAKGMHEEYKGKF